MSSRFEEGAAMGRSSFGDGARTGLPTACCGVGGRSLEREERGWARLWGKGCMEQREGGQGGPLPPGSSTGHGGVGRAGVCWALPGLLQRCGRGRARWDELTSARRSAPWLAARFGLGCRARGCGCERPAGGPCALLLLPARFPGAPRDEWDAKRWFVQRRAGSFVTRMSRRCALPGVVFDGSGANAARSSGRDVCFSFSWQFL